ncbi:VanZ family protein [Paenibacillus sp. RC67]|uniref:VanZ family protein n=1 Tax=Paenibacillus sp. RC67 TaxID=3039392 RepID=UPI0024ADB014|nr:VanZ family protein [Paenibacillus sp. RC67]
MYRIRFGKFILFFILAILVLETLQALTYLGSFDIDDVISNTLGAGIGFVAYKVGFSSKISFKKLAASALSIGVLLVGIMTISETIHYAMAKREGPIQALSDLKEMNESMPMTRKLPSFTVAGEKVEPKMNVYSSEDGKSTKYTYILGNKKDVMFYGYYGILDNEDFQGEVTLLVDGELRAQLNEQYDEDAVVLDFPVDRINEVTFIIAGNAKLWDVGFTEMKHWWE